MMSRRWALVALSCVEVLTATGIMFGWSALSLALRREGVYDELCAEGESGCDAQILRLAAVYAAGATTIPLSGMAWGPLLDAKGAKTARLLSLAIFAPSCVLFAFADSRTFDVYIPAAALISVGGMGFFFSHFVIAEHFAADHFALVHSLINCSFDASTVTFTVLELLHRAGATSRALFLGMACLGALYASLSSEWIWAGHLFPPAARRRPDAANDDDARAAVAGSNPADAAPASAAPTPQFGAGLDESGKTFSAQVRTPAFAWLMAWSVIAIYRTMLVLGSISEQMSRGGDGDGRSLADAEDLVRAFNFLILVSAALTPPFGRFVDARGMPAGFVLVNTLGVFTFAALFAEPAWVLYLAFLAFGCFRAWNYSLMTTYAQGVFGGESFGKIYGIGAGLAGTVAAAMQYPTAALAVNSGGGGYRALDLAMVGAGVVSFAFPAFIRSRLRRGRETKRDGETAATMA